MILGTIVEGFKKMTTSIHFLIPYDHQGGLLQDMPKQKLRNPYNGSCVIPVGWGYHNPLARQTSLSKCGASLA